MSSTSTENGNNLNGGQPVIIGTMSDKAMWEDVPIDKMTSAAASALTVTKGGNGSGSKKRKSNESEDSIRITNALFLTYPQYYVVPPNSSSDHADKVDLDVIKEDLKFKLARYGELDEGVIAREKHADGNWHLHAYIHFKPDLQNPERKRTILHKDLELDGHRGDYQVPRSSSAVTKYCTKEGDYVWWGVDPTKARAARTSHTKIMKEDLVTGKTSVHDFIAQNPDQIGDYLNLKRNLMAWKADSQTRTAPPQVLWLQGPPGIGKTSVARAASATTFIVPLAKTDQMWWMDGDSGQDVIMFDNLTTLIQLSLVSMTQPS